MGQREIDERKLGRARKQLGLAREAHLRKVFGLVQSSKRILYPTSSPSDTSISSATRLATDMAATRRGWVHATWSPGRRR